MIQNVSNQNALYIAYCYDWQLTKYEYKNFSKDLQPQVQMYVLLHVNKIYRNFHQSVYEKRQTDIMLFIYLPME